MKKILIAITLIPFIACHQSEKPLTTGEVGYYGEKIDESEAIAMNELITQMGDKAEMQAKFTGTVVEVCQEKGCWMTIDRGDGSTMRVTFKDYGFFVPMNIAGKTAVMRGFAYTDTTSVDQLRHYAEDAGKPAEEIEKITEPEVALAFEADGVIIK